MKIALVYDLIYPFTRGGVERRISDLAIQLANRGHDVHVFGTKQWDGPDRVVRHGVTFHGVRDADPVHSRSGRRSIRQALVIAWSLYRSLRIESFDVVDVQAMAPLACVATLLAGQASGNTTVVTWHEVWGRYWLRYMGALGIFGMAAEKAIIHLGSHHAAVSQSTLTKLSELGVHEVTFLPNGVDLAQIDAVDAAAESSDVVYIGRLVGHKNVGMLIEAVEQMARHGLKPTVRIVGDGPQREELDELATELDNVSFAGEIETDDEVISLLKAASVFAFPSVREGFGLAALEALACGLPVITVEHPDNAATDFVRSGLNGIVVKPDLAAFADALTLLLTDESLRETLSINAIASVRPYDLDTVVAEVEATYARLAEIDMIQRPSLDPDDGRKADSDAPSRGSRL